MHSKATLPPLREPFRFSTCLIIVFQELHATKRCAYKLMRYLL
jgi:hypothetical protein